jgi:alanine transaminase
MRQETISENIKNFEYAVRGSIAIRAMQIEREMEKGFKYPFEKIVHLNIGNPQNLGQKPITFNREVLASCLHDDPEKNKLIFSPEAVERANYYLSHIEHRAVGAYTDSPGIRVIMREVRDFIQNRDNVEVDEDNIYLTNGASEGIGQILRLLIQEENDGIMIPTPQYPIYSALVTRFGGKQIKYYLDESRGWGLNYDELERSYSESLDAGANPKAIVIINPGNPTGQVLKEEDLARVLQFAHDKQLFVIADEVYQKNIYVDKEFVSTRRALHNLGAPYNRDIELASFHSLSKGLLGECGLRGGYMELLNLDDFAKQMLYKGKAVNLCSNTIGQIGVGLMVNPPTAKTVSKECFDQYRKEEDAIFKGLQGRAKMLSQKLNEMEGVSCNDVEGAMYAFPKIQLPSKYLDE